MNGMENIPAWAAVVISVLLVVGGSISLIGALGLMRLPSFYQRIHGPAITMVYFTVLQSRLVVHEVIITAFLMMTAPVVSMLLMRAAVYRELRAGKMEMTKAAKDIYSTLPRK